MDPITILSIAAAVVQFLDFSFKFVSQGVQGYKYATGKPNEITDLKAVANGLGSLFGEVEGKSRSLGVPATGSPEEMFLRYCMECKEIAKLLTSAIDDELSPEESKRKASARRIVSGALHSVFAQGTITKLKQRLLDIRAQVSMAALVCLWGEAKSQGNLLKLLSQQQSDILAALGQIDRSTKSFQDELRTTIVGHSLENQRARSKIVQATWDADWVPPTSMNQVSSAQDPAKFADFCRIILSEMSYGTIRNREEQIPEAYLNTYQWIYTSASSDFPKWLQSDTRDIFWITGKAGSGKSTLMKFISTTPNLAEKFKPPVGANLPAIIATFYFWIAGTNLQKSQEGLLRTLLHQWLSEKPDLIPSVCSRRWFLLEMFGESEIAPEWAWNELVESLNKFADHCAGQYKLPLFIDGLDEFDGDHSELVKFIKGFSMKDGVKICVSSRPWNVFNDAFSRTPSLRLETLSLVDIKCFITGHFEENEGYRELKAVQPAKAEKLTNDILNKAGGVFLWVDLVVRNLLAGLREGDKLVDLLITVDSLPPDLEDLFDAIWNRIDKRYRPDASRYFELLEASTDGLQALCLWIIDEDNLDLDVSLMDQLALDAVVKITSRRVNSRTLGLLEVSARHQSVDYLHRTVKEWVRHPERWMAISKESPDEFGPRLEFFKYDVISMTRGNKSATHSTLQVFWRDMSEKLATVASINPRHGTVDRLVKIVDKFDENASALFEKYKTTDDTINWGGSSDQTWKNAKHWTWTQTVPSRKNTFLGIAAQFTIIPYIMRKIRQSPALLLHEEPPSILENAIFGYKETNPGLGGYGDNSIAMGHSTADLNQEKRLLLVRLLCKRGASPDQTVEGGISIRGYLRKHVDYIEGTECSDRYKEYLRNVSKLLGEDDSPS